MNTTIRKSLMLFASTVALTAIVPAMASAAVWGPLNTNHSFDGTNPNNYMKVTMPASWTGWQCTNTHFATHVRTPASSTLDITAATFSGCTGLGTWTGCTFSQTATGLPWTATAPSTGNVQINVGNVNVTMSCPSGNTSFTYSGTFGAGAWNAGTHSATWTLSPGLTMYYGGAPFSSLNVAGALKDPAQTLTLN